MSDLQALLAVVNTGNYVVLDTETTGLYDDAEIVQLAVIDSTGQVLMDTLVKPTGPIPDGATYIHGITDAMVADAPAWREVAGRLRDLVDGRLVVIYNADYDCRLIAQTCHAHHIAHLPPLQAVCAMLGYAEHHGDWNDYYGNFRWVKLDQACRHLKIPVVNAHNALGDCQMTLAVCQKLAALYKESKS